MLQVDMTASVRTETGKGAMRRLRAEGMSPAVMYGIGEEALSLQLETKTLTQKLLEYSRKNTVVTLKIDNGEEKSVLIREIQTDPVSDVLLHTDFQEIDLEKPRTFDVPVEYTGKAKGIDLGGIENVNTTKIVLEGKPLDIPDSCPVDTSDLAIGDAIKVGEIAIPENVKLLSNSEAVCINIEAPAVS